MKPLVIYHGDCFDGFTAAWIWRRFYGNDADFFGARYGEPAPEVAGREVWVLDFCYPREVMKRIFVEAAKTIVLDHHKTAKANLDGLLDELEADFRATVDPIWRPAFGEIEFDMARSGAGMTWDRLRGRATRPWLVDYVEDRDLWKLALPDARQVSAWIAAQPMTFEAWDELLAKGLLAAVESGRHVQAYIEQYGRKARAEATLERIGEHVVPAINLPYMNCSEHVGALLGEHPEAPFAAGYFRRRDGRWQFSLRSRPDFDVSEVAKMFGGGGHAGAAGFDVEDLWRVFRGEEA